MERVGRATRGLLADDRKAQSGVDPYQASGFFGLDLQTLLDVYGHHHPDHMQDAVQKMARPCEMQSEGRLCARSED